MGIPAIPRGSMAMIPAALSSDAMEAESAALSNLLLVLRSEVVLDDPGAPSFAAGFNPVKHIVFRRGRDFSRTSKFACALQDGCKNKNTGRERKHERKYHRRTGNAKHRRLTPIDKHRIHECNGEKCGHLFP